MPRNFKPKKVSRKRPTEGEPLYHAAVYLAPHGCWSWQIFYGDEVLIRGAGYPSSSEASNDCQRFLTSYDPEVEVRIQVPGSLAIPKARQLPAD